jgi:Retroviral aspartyl protease
LIDSFAPLSVQASNPNNYAGWKKTNIVDFLNTLETEEYYAGEKSTSAAGHAATMTLHGSANGVDACVLFESGPTGNFVSRKFALKLGLRLKELPGIAVQAASGTAACDAEVNNVRIKIN